jgi:hypothetical protein
MNVPRLMMRACVLLALCLSACDDDTGSMTPIRDLSTVSNVDQTAAPGSCNAVAACASMCTAANLVMCGVTCLSKLSADAKPYFDAVTACTDKYCSTFVDGGTAKCDADPSTKACHDCTTMYCQSQVNACLAH